MRLRFHSVLILTLAFFVTGSGMQGAVCNLVCALGGGVQCHGAPTASVKSASTDAMAGMHCSHMKASRAIESAASSLHVDSGAMELCRHPSSVAMICADSAGESVAAVHWVVVHPMPMQRCIAADRSIANANALPLCPPADTLPVALRV